MTLVEPVSEPASISSRPQYATVGLQPAARVVVESGMNSQTDTQAVPMDLLKPYLLVACVAFMLGFAAFLAAGWAVTPRTASAEAWAVPASAPAEPAASAGTRLI